MLKSSRKLQLEICVSFSLGYVQFFYKQELRYVGNVKARRFFYFKCVSTIKLLLHEKEIQCVTDFQYDEFRLCIGEEGISCKCYGSIGFLLEYVTLTSGTLE